MPARGDTPEAVIDWLRSPDAQRAEPWQRQMLASWPWGKNPKVGTLRAMRAALDTCETDPVKPDRD